MFTKLLFSRGKSKPLIAKYKKYKKISNALSSKILDEFIDDRSLSFISQLMGVMQGKALILESEIEADFLMDFNLFEYQVDGKHLPQRYLEKRTDISPEEAEIIEAYFGSYTSLFKLVGVDRESATITLIDLLNHQKEVKVIDINLSRTASTNLLMFARIIPLQDLNMLSGVLSMFSADMEKYLLRQSKIMMRRVKSQSESIRRYIAFFKLNRTQGLEVKTTDI
jgi:hypothetical protein